MSSASGNAVDGYSVPLVNILVPRRDDGANGFIRAVVSLATTGMPVQAGPAARYIDSLGLGRGHCRLRGHLAEIVRRGESPFRLVDSRRLVDVDSSERAIGPI